MDDDDISWWEVQAEIEAHMADDASGLLVGYGATAVEVVCDDIVPPPLPNGEQPTRQPVRPGWAVLRIAFDREHPRDAVAQLTHDALSELGARAEISVVERRDSRWRHRWKEFFTPVQVGDRLWVIPEWERSRTSLPDGALPIILDPGLAFGTGQHPTTRSCLRALERHVAGCDRILDVGCGSGILSIAAARLGVGRVVAIDNDPQAVRATQDNAALNDVPTLIDASATPLDALADSFPLVVANILASILMDLAPDLVARTAAGGLLVLSGILTDQGPEVHERFITADPRHTLTRVEQLQDGEWVVLVYRVDVA